MITRKRIAMIMAEFLGTALLTLTVLAVKNSGVGNMPIFVAMAAGLALAAAMLMLSAVSGAHLNPAITLGLWSVRKIKALPAVVYIASQLLGGIAAYYLYTYFIGQTFTHPTGEFVAARLVAEAVGGLVLAMAWAAIVYQRLDTGRSAAVVGLAYAVGIAATSVAAYSFLNPAVSFGTQSWVLSTTVLGPVLGAIIGFNLYSLLFAPASELVEAPAKPARAKK